MNSINDIKAIIELEQTWTAKAKQLLNFYSAMGMYEHCYISIKIIEKICDLQRKLINNTTDLMLNYSTLRYCLEALIQSKLLVKEKSFVYKLYFSIYIHQIKKAQNFIDRLDREIRLIAEYEKLENEIEIPVSIESTWCESEIKEKMDEFHEKVQCLYDRASEELTLFFGDVENNGFTFQKHIMENELRDTYSKRIVHLLNLKRAKEREILSDARIKSLFNFNGQPSKVFSELEDKRSWSAKAKETNLEKEYELIYELSSAILHSFSYSLITPNETEEDEQELTLKMICKYSKETLQVLNNFIDYASFSKFNVVTL